MTVRKIALTAMLTGIALVIFIIEAQIPVPLKIPGIKIGLANIVTLFALVSFGGKEAFTVMSLRIIIGSIFTGSLPSLLYSACGGVCCFAVMYAAIKILGTDMLWGVSALGGIAHNAGQLLAATVMMGTSSVFAYMPFLTLSGIVTGIFTGMCAYYVLKNKHIRKLTENFK